MSYGSEEKERFNNCLKFPGMVGSLRFRNSLMQWILLGLVSALSVNRVVIGEIGTSFSPLPSQLSRLSEVVWKAEGKKLEFFFNLQGPKVEPSSVSFFVDGTRVIVEFPATLKSRGCKLGVAPETMGVVDWGVVDVNLTRCRFWVEFPYRIPADNLQVKFGRHGVRLTISPFYEREDRYLLSKELCWYRREEAEPGRYLLWNELRFPSRLLGEQKSFLKLVLAHDRIDSRESVRRMVLRNNAVAGINGGFFSTQGGPLGIVVKDGALLSPHVKRRPPRTTFVLDNFGRIQFLRLVSAEGKLLVPGGKPVQDVFLALVGGPRLLKGGQIAVDAKEEGLGPGGNDITRRAARTALALTRSDEVLLACASGYRDNHLEGILLGELAHRLRLRGAVEAMNLDGGASTTMVVGRRVVSFGPGNLAPEKNVATALLLCPGSERWSRFPARIKLHPSKLMVRADGISTIQVEAEILDLKDRPVDDGTVVYVYPRRCKVSRAKLFTKNGRVKLKVVSVKLPAKASVRFEVGAAAGEFIYEQQAGPPAALYYKYRLFTPGRLLDKSVVSGGTSKARQKNFKQDKVELWVQLNDSIGNPIREVEVEVQTGEERFKSKTGFWGVAKFRFPFPPTGYCEVYPAGLKSFRLRLEKRGGWGVKDYSRPRIPLSSLMKIQATSSPGLISQVSSDPSHQNCWLRT